MSDNWIIVVVVVVVPAVVNAFQRSSYFLLWMLYLVAWKKRNFGINRAGTYVVKCNFSASFSFVVQQTKPSRAGGVQVIIFILSSKGVHFLFFDMNYIAAFIEAGFKWTFLVHHLKQSISNCSHQAHSHVLIALSGP